MEFGKVGNIENIEFRLPPNHKGTIQILGGKKSNTLNIYIGAPVWNDPGFPGKIYPAKALSKDYVKYYGQQFNSIELNATHYRIPDENTVQRWVDAVPERFKFCPKIHQSISHSNDISKCVNEINIFHHIISGFGHKLGTSFLQLPPKFDTNYLNLLIRFLEFCPIRDLAIELRHESWFTDNTALNNLSNFLFKNNFSFNITDVAGRRDALHQRLTNKTAFVRFVANNLHPSDFKRMDDWVERINEWIEAGLENLYFFMHTPDKGLTPELSIYFINQLNKNYNLKLTPPKILSAKIENNKLF